MTQIAYYAAGRGLLTLSHVTEQAIDAGMLRALQLVGKEAADHHHRVRRWHIGPDTSFARCVGCGHTAVVTRCHERLFVDSCVHARCPCASPAPSVG